MPRRTPHITVSAVVSPAVHEEIGRLAGANKVTRSQMINQLLEAQLTQRANARLEDAYDRLEKRLARMEERFAALMVKIGRAAAQSLFVTMKLAEMFYREKHEQQKLWLDSKHFAGKFLENRTQDSSQKNSQQ